MYLSSSLVKTRLGKNLSHLNLTDIVSPPIAAYDVHESEFCNSKPAVTCNHADIKLLICSGYPSSLAPSLISTGTSKFRLTSHAGQAQDFLQTVNYRGLSLPLGESTDRLGGVEGKRSSGTDFHGGKIAYPGKLSGVSVAPISSQSRSNIKTVVVEYGKDVPQL
jgi:hypothetical protein